MEFYPESAFHILVQTRPVTRDTKVRLGYIHTTKVLTLLLNLQLELIVAINYFGTVDLIKNTCLFGLYKDNCYIAITKRKICLYGKMLTILKKSLERKTG